MKRLLIIPLYLLLNNLNAAEALALKAKVLAAKVLKSKALAKAVGAGGIASLVGYQTYKDEIMAHMIARQEQAARKCQAFKEIEKQFEFKENGDVIHTPSQYYDNPLSATYDVEGRLTHGGLRRALAISKQCDCQDTYQKLLVAYAKQKAREDRPQKIDQNWQLQKMCHELKNNKERNDY